MVHSPFKVIKPKPQLELLECPTINSPMTQSQRVSPTIQHYLPVSANGPASDFSSTTNGEFSNSSLYKENNKTCFLPNIYSTPALAQITNIRTEVKPSQDKMKTHLCILNTPTSPKQESNIEAALSQQPLSKMLKHKILKPYNNQESIQQEASTATLSGFSVRVRPLLELISTRKQFEMSETDLPITTTTSTTISTTTITTIPTTTTTTIPTTTTTRTTTQITTISSTNPNTTTSIIPTTTTTPTSSLIMTTSWTTQNTTTSTNPTTTINSNITPLAPTSSTDPNTRTTTNTISATTASFTIPTTTTSCSILTTRSKSSTIPTTSKTTPTTTASTTTASSTTASTTTPASIITISTATTSSTIPTTLSINPITTTSTIPTISTRTTNCTETSSSLLAAQDQTDKTTLDDDCEVLRIEHCPLNIRSDDYPSRFVLSSDRSSEVLELHTAPDRDTQDCRQQTEAVLSGLGINCELSSEELNDLSNNKILDLHKQNSLHNSSSQNRQLVIEHNIQAEILRRNLSVNSGGLPSQVLASKPLNQKCELEESLTQTLKRSLAQKRSSRRNLPMSQELQNYLGLSESLATRLQSGSNKNTKRLLYTEEYSNTINSNQLSKLGRLPDSTTQVAHAPPTRESFEHSIPIMPPLSSLSENEDRVDVQIESASGVTSTSTKNENMNIIEVIIFPPRVISTSPIETNIHEDSNTKQLENDDHQNSGNADQESFHMEGLRMLSLMPLSIPRLSPTSQAILDNQPSTSHAAREALKQCIEKKQLKHKNQDKPKNSVNSVLAAVQESNVSLNMSKRRRIGNNSFQTNVSVSLNACDTGKRRRSERGHIPLRNTWCHTLEDPFAFMRDTGSKSCISKLKAQKTFSNKSFSEVKRQLIFNGTPNLNRGESDSTTNRSQHDKQQRIKTRKEIIKEPEHQLISSSPVRRSNKRIAQKIPPRKKRKRARVENVDEVQTQPNLEPGNIPMGNMEVESECATDVVPQPNLETDQSLSESMPMRLQSGSNKNTKRLLYTEEYSNTINSNQLSKLGHLPDSATQVAHAPPRRESFEQSIPIMPPLSSLSENEDIVDVQTESASGITSTSTKNENMNIIEVIFPPRVISTSAIETNIHEDSNTKQLENADHQKTGNADQESFHMEGLRMLSLTPPPIPRLSPTSQAILDNQPSTSHAAREALKQCIEKKQLKHKNQDKPKNSVNSVLAAVQESNASLNMSKRRRIGNHAFQTNVSVSLNACDTGKRRRSERGHIPLRNTWCYTLEDPFAFMRDTVSKSCKSKLKAQKTFSNKSFSEVKRQLIFNDTPNLNRGESDSTTNRSQHDKQQRIKTRKEIIEEPEHQLISSSPVRRSNKRIAQKIPPRKKRKLARVENVDEVQTQPNLEPGNIPMGNMEVESECATDVVPQPNLEIDQSPDQGHNDFVDWLRGSQNMLPGSIVVSSTNINKTDSVDFMPSSQLRFTLLEDIEYAFYATENNVTLGYMRFQAMQVRGFKPCKSKFLRFIVFYGQFNFQICRPNSEDLHKYVLNTGDMIEIKDGNRYSIRNSLNEVSVLFVNHQK